MASELAAGLSESTRKLADAMVEASRAVSALARAMHLRRANSGPGSNRKLALNRYRRERAAFNELLAQRAATELESMRFVVRTSPEGERTITLHERID